MTPGERNAITSAPAFLLLASATLGTALLLAQLPGLSVQPVGWRAFAGAALGITAEGIAGMQLLRSGTSRAIAAIAFALQAVAFSIDACAYRLIAGPYIVLAMGPDGFRMGAGIDARYLFILGESNRVPPGLSINLIAVVGLALLLMRPNE